MRIGIDFDNTIADYNDVFTPVAIELGLVELGFEGDKRAVHNHVYADGSGEKEWMRLQGQLYGKHMWQAALMNGFSDFMSACKNRTETVFIISHKTEYGHFDNDKVPLREVAVDWMRNHHFFDPGGFDLNCDNVIFASTRAEKVAHIRDARCTHFIDDLVEVFEYPGFPSGIKQYLLHAAPEKTLPNVKACASWADIQHDIFDR